MHRRADLDDLPRPDAGAQDLMQVRPVGGLRIGRRCPPQAAGLRNLLGGCDQMRDKNRVGLGWLRTGSLRPLRRRDHWHERNAGGLCIRNDAIIYRLLWLTAT